MTRTLSILTLTRVTDTRDHGTGDWREGGACVGVDPEMWFLAEYNQAAKRVCNACPVVAQCLEWAIENRADDGVWGATTEDERALIRRRRGTPRALAEITHGTRSGYRQHLRRNQTPCDSCRDAERLRTRPTGGAS